MTDSYTMIMCREVLITSLSCYNSQFVTQPDLARHPKNSGLLTWDNGGTTTFLTSTKCTMHCGGRASPDNGVMVNNVHAAKQHFDEYKISTMHCGWTSLAIVHKVHNESLVLLCVMTKIPKCVFCGCTC